MDDNYRSSFAGKYPERGVADRGFAPIPKCLITCMRELDLKPQEAAILFNIIEKCWKAGDSSWQKVDTMAQNIGRKNSATRAITKSLVEKGFITKTQRYDSSNIYGLEPLGHKLAEHLLEECRHIARKPKGGSQNYGSRGSQITSDYIEPGLNKTINSDPLYSHIVNNNGDESDIEIVSRKNILHPCEADNGDFIHDWDEPFDVYKGMNKFGEQLIWRYRSCKRCQDKFHTKANPKDYRWENGELINIHEYAKMEVI
jgi:predicted transcriptional regulator